MNKSLFGIILGSAAIALAMSPKGRKAARKLAVKGTGAFLDMKDQIKEAAQLQSVLRDSKRE
ncbi:hypothetical protein [Paenibacillus sedimenti]|uniref:YtxH domain-containing protein n=1 Tax=Paenibacillus sedimenti TaxID=2770274 RepID=A0A926KW37_9BACL|nr:hypothetical protein [Paenibacillus sedimenti]MBD0384241.1 hypothetical protein [Paenibacillus sedimenti]